MFKRLRTTDDPVDKTGPREIGWFIVLWVLGVAGLGVAAGVIRLVLGAW